MGPSDVKATNTPLSATLVENASAQKSYAKNGAEIGLGKRTTRVSFEANQGNEKTLVAVASSWNIFLGDLLKPFTKTNPFVVKIILADGKTVDVNIRSLAKRLHISKTELMAKIHQEGKSSDGHEVESFISSHLSKNENLLEVLDHHQKFMDKLTGFTLTSTSKSIMEIYKRSIGAESEQSGVMTSKLTSDIAWFKAEGKSGDVYIFLKKDFFDEHTKIGEGSFGRAHSSGDKYVLKVAIDSVEGADTSIFHEAAILKKIHDACKKQGIEPVGIMKPPKAVYKLNPNGINPISAYFVARYESDGAKVKQPDGKAITPQVLSKGFAKIFSGLSIMHSLEIYHGDIKLPNMSVDEGGTDWKHADFGGAMDFSEIKDKESMESFFKEFSVGPFSATYCSQQNMSDLIEAGESGDYATFKKLMEKRDNFAASVALVKKAFDTSGNGHKVLMKMFSTEKIPGSELKALDKCLWSKEVFTSVMEGQGYSTEVAENLYILIQNCLVPIKGDTSDPRALRENLIKILEA